MVRLEDEGHFPGLADGQIHIRLRNHELVLRRGKPGVVEDVMVVGDLVHYSLASWYSTEMVPVPLATLALRMLAPAARQISARR